MGLNEKEPEVSGHRIGTRKSLFVRPITVDTRPDELKLEFNKFGEVKIVFLLFCMTETYFSSFC